MSQLTATMTTTSTVDSTRLSLNTTSKCRWPEPQASIGAQRASLDPLGIFKCWEIKDKSPAHNVWKKVHKPILSLIKEEYEHLNAKGAKLLMEMFMIGRKEAKSSPTLLVSCELKTPRRMALDLIQKKSILSNYPGVLMAECSKFPKLLAPGDLSSLPYLREGVYLTGELGSCGTSVLVSVGDKTPSRKATIGGLVNVGDKTFGLMVGHVFENESEAQSEDSDLPSSANQHQNIINDDIQFEFYGLGDSDYSSEGDDVTEATSYGR